MTASRSLLSYRTDWQRPESLLVEQNLASPAKPKALVALSGAAKQPASLGHPFPSPSEAQINQAQEVSRRHINCRTELQKFFSLQQLCEKKKKKRGGANPQTAVLSFFCIQGLQRS